MTDTPERWVAPALDDVTAAQPGPSYEAPPGYQFPPRFQSPTAPVASPESAVAAFGGPNQVSYPPPSTPWPPAPYPAQGSNQPPTSYPPLATYPPPAGAPYQASVPLDLDLSSQFPSGYDARLPDGHRVAHFGRRFAARLIDTAIALSVFFMTNALFAGGFVITTVSRTASGRTSFYSLSTSGWSAVFIIGFLLEVVTVAVFGAQLGKLIMGIRLANARTLATPIGWPSAALRWIISTVALLLCLLPGLVLMLSPLWNQPWRRGWQDRLSNTVVIEK